MSDVPGSITRNKEQGVLTATPLVTPPNSTSKKRKSDDEAVFHDSLVTDNATSESSPASFSWAPNNKSPRRAYSSNGTKRKLDLGIGRVSTAADNTPAATSGLRGRYETAGARLASSRIDYLSSNRSTCSSQVTPNSQALTQPVVYSQDLAAGLKQDETPTPKVVATLVDWNDKTHDNQNKAIDIPKFPVILGRSSECGVQIRNNRSIGRKHCSLTFVDLDGTCYLTALPKQTCWIQDLNTNGWKVVQEDSLVRIQDRQRFRLLPPGNDVQANSPGAEYVLNLKVQGALKAAHPGSHSFDIEYLKLLRMLQFEGVLKEKNKKGPNKTLPLCCPLTINLRDTSGTDRNLLPLTSLRSLYGGRGALIEALWYLRGEGDISFLQANKCHFWDKQAIKKDGVDWVGLSYGLLTNFPQTHNRPPINQLEKNVIEVLSKPRSCSRNMICTLVKPGEETVQGACTSSVQFSVSTVPSVKMCGPSEEALNLTVTQRSSDVMVGLPHDVVVWSIILHLVRREVLKRADRKLVAGNLSFVIGQNAAHVYKINYEQMKEILKRKPIEECQPHLVVDTAFDSQDMFSLAKSYEPGMFLIRDYTKAVKHPAITLTQAL